MMIKIGMLAALLLSSTTAAAATDGPELWRGLQRGMTPDEAAVVVAKMPEIKSVKPAKMKNGKATDLKFTMVDSGIQLFGQKFDLTYVFDQSGLRSITLTSDWLCVDDGADLFNRTITVISEKYPDHMSGPREFDRLTALKALQRAYDAAETPKETTIFSGTDATVFVNQAFGRVKPPEYMSGSKVARLAYQLLRASYESQLGECGGTGDRRMAVVVSYAATDDFRSIVHSLSSERDAEDQAARAGL